MEAITDKYQVRRVAMGKSIKIGDVHCMQGEGKGSMEDSLDWEHIDICWFMFGVS